MSCSAFSYFENPFVFFLLHQVSYDAFKVENRGLGTLSWRATPILALQIQLNILTLVSFMKKKKILVWKYIMPQYTTLPLNIINYTCDSFYIHFLFIVMLGANNSGVNSICLNDVFDNGFTMILKNVLWDELLYESFLQLTYKYKQLHCVCYRNVTEYDASYRMNR